MIPLSRIGVTPQKAAQFETKRIFCVEDLAQFFPRRYIDFRARTDIRDLHEGEYYRVVGIIKHRSVGSRVEICLNDGTGELVVTWFNGCYFYADLSVGTEWEFCGKVTEFMGAKQMVQPMLHSSSAGRYACIYPVYSKIGGMSANYLEEKLKAAMSLMATNVPWSEQDVVARSFGLMDRVPAMKEMHTPKSREFWKRANRRLVYDQIWSFYEELYARKASQSFVSGKLFSATNETDAFIRSLPFPLTADQTRAVQKVKDATVSGKAYHALVSGDVGCGKTAVALIDAVLAWENGYQSVIMAPTLVLAKQHYEEMSNMAKGRGINFALLTSEATKKKRAEILKKVESGEVDVLIGTHSVLSDELVFHNLGMTIVDEEHRFGAQQKQVLSNYDKIGAHHVALTATPIPRSYASAIYADSLDIVTIETMPAGRKTTITEIEVEREAAYAKVMRELDLGHQAYVICPFIEDSDNDKFKDIMSVSAVTKELEAYCAKHRPGITVSCISGDMKQKEILAEIDAFARNDVQVLVSTTIVEVGVNVPNATAIVVMNAERFGLSALHQLRGRVGRKGDQGYCYLVSNQKSEKLEVMVKHSSGFEIAELDMKLRGPGDILGEAQTGNSKVVDLILRNPNLTKAIKGYFEEKK